jgi:hypothetical protein
MKILVQLDCVPGIGFSPPHVIIPFLEFISTNFLARARIKETGKEDASFYDSPEYIREKRIKTYAKEAEDIEAEEMRARRKESNNVMR